MGSHSIGQRALRRILLFSLLLTATTSLGLFSIRHRRQEAAIAAEVDNLRKAQTPALVAALWSSDREQLAALVEGLCIFPYINYAAVSDQGGEMSAAGARKPGSRVERFPLLHNYAGRDFELGTLELHTDTERILSNLEGEILLSLGFQAFLLLFESLFIVLIFERMVTRHLVAIAGQVRGFELDAPHLPLALDKRSAGDELDILAEAFNGMERRLKEARAQEELVVAELRESEARNRNLVEEAPDAILVYDADAGRFVDCNRRAELLFERERSAIVGAGLEELYAPAQPDGRPIAESSRENLGRVLGGESLLIRRDVIAGGGRLLLCEVRLTRFPVKGRKLVRASFLDITDRLRAEEAMAQALREKEVLLREVYHRTKNNMQIIAALLDMQAYYSKDERVAVVMKEMVGRIKSMALVHEKLYRARDLSRIDLGDYFREFLEELRHAFLEGRAGLRLALTAEPGIETKLDVAIPCGLALNELVVNAIKYAFPDGRPGSISVGLSRSPEGGARITVADDGAGLPPGFDPRRDGKLGLQTVVALIEQQLGGRIEVVSGPGTRWTAELPPALEEGEGGEAGGGGKPQSSPPESPPSSSESSPSSSSSLSSASASSSPSSRSSASSSSKSASS